MQRGMYIHKSVTIYRKNLVYDIDFESWKIAHMRVEDKALQMESGTDMEAGYFIERCIDTAKNELVSNLLFCIDRQTSTGDNADNRLNLASAEGADIIVSDGGDLDEVVEVPNTDSGNNSASEEDVFPDYYSFGFRFSQFWQGNINSLASAINGYIKSFVLSEWFSIVMPDVAPKYVADASAYLSKVIDIARMERIDGITYMI